MAIEEDRKSEDAWEEFEVRLPRRLPMLILYIILAIIIAVLVVFGVRALYRHSHENKVKTVPANTKQLPSQPGLGSTNNKTQSGSTKSTKTSNNSSTKNANIPNTGSEGVVAIFIGTTIAASGLHYLVNLQRSSKTA